MLLAIAIARKKISLFPKRKRDLLPQPKKKKNPIWIQQIAGAEHALAISREIGHSTDVIKLERRLQRLKAKQ